ncbi:MAG: mannitol dehydrogenase family protein [Lachnospiraceae bacterium]|nr:mannitol dehydrogenase family protein [Lachnospiraceae bacterium]
MKLQLSALQEREFWDGAGIALPGYDVEKVYQRTKEEPVWVHFGIGNIFRSFLGRIADQMLAEGKTDRGLTCVETFDYDVVDQIYDPCENLGISVILNPDGTRDTQVLGCFAEALRADWRKKAAWSRLKEIFRSASLQMVSLTITEKGYALQDAEGHYFPSVLRDLENGPEQAGHAMTILTAMLLERYEHGGAAPIALVSMDNCSQNGKRLRDSILAVAQEWESRALVPADFVRWVSDEDKAAFPWTMIDKITPRPSLSIAEELSEKGLEDMQPVMTDKKTFIAPFVNAERPQYLVVEDHFPNGRPPLETGGVYLTDRETVNKAERMKVTACLNPIHTALCTYDCMLGYELFADGMSDPELKKLAHRIGYDEGLPVVPDPGILSPKAFLDEVIRERFPNPYLDDTSQRIATDISQMVGIRFGETIKAYVKRDGSACALKGIALAIAGWLRYLLALDDEGRPMELAPDPMIPQLQRMLSGIKFGAPEEAVRAGALKEILSNERIFGVNLYEAGIGSIIEAMFCEETAGPGAVRQTLRKYLS